MVPGLDFFTIVAILKQLHSPQKQGLIGLADFRRKMNRVFVTFHS